MKKTLLLLPIVLIAFWGCEEEQEPEDCAGVAGGNSVEAGIMEMLVRMQTKRLKIFKNQSKLLEELRMHHRKDGKIVPMNDDLISALRYCIMSLRKARLKIYEPIQQFTDSEFNVFAR